MKTFPKKTLLWVSAICLGLGSVSVVYAANAPDGSTSSKALVAVDDSVITTKIKTKLLADDEVKSTDISVETVGGEVSLSGFVDNQRQVERAVEIARGVEGVKKITNKMSVKVANG